MRPAFIKGSSVPWFHLVCVLLGSCLLLFVLAPLLGMILDSSWPELAAAVRDEEVNVSMQLTLLCALAATVACTVVGVPLAYLFTRRTFFGRSLLLAIIDLPIVIPHSAAGIALLTVVGRHSLAGKALGNFGWGFVSTPLGIATAMAFVSLPFLVNGAHQAFTAVPQRLENVARTLGASPARVFLTISLPMAWRGILAGMVLMWARGISEFGAIVIIAYHPMTTPVLVYQRFNDYGLGHARSVAVLMVLVCVGIFAILRFLAKPPRTERTPDAGTPGRQ